MTRYLSQALGAEEPYFSQSIAALEQASGHPSADIHLSSDIMQKVKVKIAELGLDPNDTSSDELYNVLIEKLKNDDRQIREALHIEGDSTPDEVVHQVCQFLKKLDQPKSCFVLKTSIARKLLKARPPKVAMKQLGYRSVDSMLKRESPALVYSAALIAESPQWNKRYREQYSKLSPSDFETRKMEFFHPKTARWNKMAKSYVSTVHHNILSFKELGDIILLPIDDNVDGLAIVTLLLCLEYMNDIRAHSSYTKLQQVKPEFGRIMKQSSLAEPYTGTKIAGQDISWRMIQRYYGRTRPDYHAEVFEPHVQAEDLQWHSIEKVISKLQPALKFWMDTEYLYVMQDGKPVSMNILDVALNYCNHVPFHDRIVNFVRNNLWNELMIRYLDQHNLEDALHDQMSSGLIEEPALAQS